jgi:hypothetical protein
MISKMENMHKFSPEKYETVLIELPHAIYI